jgi:hypothetical protein
MDTLFVSHQNVASDDDDDDDDQDDDVMSLF